MHYHYYILLGVNNIVFIYTWIFWWYYSFIPSDLALAGSLLLESESEWQQVSSDLKDFSVFWPICILVWMVLIFPLISNPLNPIFRLLGSLLSPTSTTDITLTLIFLSFLSFLARPKYLSIILFSFIFTLESTRTVKYQILSCFFFFFTN